MNINGMVNIDKLQVKRRHSRMKYAKPTRNNSPTAKRYLTLIAVRNLFLAPTNSVTKQNVDLILFKMSQYN